MKILVVDDHVLSRDGVREVLKELKDDANILETSDCRETMRLVEENPDLKMILLDISLPDGNGLNMLSELRRRHPAISIVVLSAYDDRGNVFAAIRQGALGFIPKSARREVIRGALQFIFAGGVYVPPEIVGGEPPSGSRAPKPTASTNVQSPMDRGLTARQVEVLGLMMEGMSNKAISRALDTTEATVKNHVTAILKVLSVTNRTEAVVLADKFGWKLRRSN